ncbi:MAG: flagellar protein FlaG [Agathobacter sp.]|nr:flagellar protein FlaG [Agathobacter sp.]
MVEGINGAGMTYQGSSSTAQIKTETQPKAENIANEIAADEIAKDTTNISTKEASEDNANQEENQRSKQQLEKQNAKIKKAVEDINRRAMNSEAIFGIHEATNRVTIKIVDRNTKEVIKELPPEKTLDMIAKAWELAGLMVDERR